MALKISRILHAGYVIESPKAIIAFDTIFKTPFSGNCHAFPEVHFNQELIKELHFDAVFISHFHDDHFCMESLNLLPRTTPIYMFCVHDELLDLIRALGFSKVFSLQLNKSIKIKDIEVIPRQALDADVDSLFQIKSEGLNLLNVVDSWIDYDTLDLLKNESPWDLIMWPFQTMRELEVLSPSRSQVSDCLVPHEWIEQINILNPRYLIPSSCQFKMEPWSWYNECFFPITYQSFAKQVWAVNESIQVKRLDPSDSFLLDAQSLRTAERLQWIEKVSEEEQDYVYNVNVKPPPMRQIAAHFPVTEDIVGSVLSYCRDQLAKTYNSSSEQAHEYFLQPMVWQLDVVTSDQTYSFFYQLKEGKIAALVDATNALFWKTEISLYKIYSALHEGEALTSLYIRVNDQRFDERTETQLADIDAIEDPLIRSLYDGSLGTYQKAQLQRLNVQF